MSQSPARQDSLTPDTAERARLIAAQRRESLGLLASRVAHDFNNMLAGILGCGELMREDLPPGSPAVPHLDLVLDSAKRGGVLCRQVLDFANSHAAAGVTARCDLNQAVRAHQRLLAVCPSSRVKVAFNFDGSIPPAAADAGVVGQILLNLMFNAAEAIGGAAGEITVATGALAAEKRVYVEVRDTGLGITLEIQGKIFTPGFTTKADRRGLGLAVARWLAAESSGAITFESQPGQGATFRLLLPVAN